MAAMALLKKPLSWLVLGVLLAFAAFVAVSIRSADGPERKQIYVFLPSIDNPFWLEVRNGVERKASELGEDFDVRIVTTASTDGSDQIDQMTTAIARGEVDAIVLAPTNDRAPAPLIAQLNQSGIKVVLIDSDLNPEAAQQVGAKWDAFVGSDNRLGGKYAAEAIIERLASTSGPKSVLLLKGSYVHQSAIDRAEGFIAAARPSLTVVERSAEWSKQAANELTAALFSRQPVQAIFASNDEMALGAVAALKTLRIPADRWPIIIGFDATGDAQAAIREGTMFASVRQQAAEMGSLGLERAAALVQGMALSPETAKTLVPVDVFTGADIVGNDTVREP